MRDGDSNSASVSGSNLRASVTVSKPKPVSIFNSINCKPSILEVQTDGWFCSSKEKCRASIASHTCRNEHRITNFYFSAAVMQGVQQNLEHELMAGSSLFWLGKPSPTPGRQGLPKIIKLQSFRSKPRWAANAIWMVMNRKALVTSSNLINISVLRRNLTRPSPSQLLGCFCIAQESPIA